MKRIWIVTHFCSDFESKGNNRFNYLAKLLYEAGYEVDFITSDFSHVKKRARTADAADPSIHVTLIHESGYQKNVSIRRIKSHKEFGKNLSRKIAGMEKPNAVYLAIPSLDAGKATADYCMKNKIPLIIDVQDLWPEAFSIALHRYHIPSRILAPMIRTANEIYKNSNAIVAVSSAYLKRAMMSGDKQGLCVYIGTDLNVFDAYPRKNMEKPDDEVWITYIGTLGNSYNIGIVIDAVRDLKSKCKQSFRFKIFGDGPDIEEYKAESKGLPIDFYGRILYKDMVGYIRNCDIAVNPIVKGAAQSIINKHADYAAAGLPVVNTQECQEYRDLLERYQCGINCPVDDTDAVADALQQLIDKPDLRKQMGRNSRIMAEEKFDRAKTYQSIVDLIGRYVNI